MVFMVFLFGYSNKILNDNQATVSGPVALFPEYSVMMTMDFGNARIERIGPSWRSVGKVVVAPEQVAQMVQHWQSTLVEMQDYQPLLAPYVVSVLLAGEAQARVYQLAQQGEALVLNHQGVSYLVLHHSLADLYPQALLQ